MQQLISKKILIRTENRQSYFYFPYGLIKMIEKKILECSCKKPHKYSGTGKLSLEDGQEFDCEFVVFQLKDGEILFHANHCQTKIQYFFPLK